MTTADIDNALRSLNIPPLYGHSLRRPGSPPPAFRRLHPAVGPPVYMLEDEEVDFEKVVKEEEIQVPRSVRWSGTHFHFYSFGSI
jgi:transcription initiation factor TFIID subunit 6